MIDNKSRNAAFHHKDNKPPKEINDTQGESMNNWGIVKVWDHKGYRTFYSNEYGLISGIRISCYPVDKDGKIFRDIYADYNTRTLKKDGLLDSVGGYAFDLDTIFDLTFYKRKPQARSSYYYQNSITKADVDKIDEVKYSVTIEYSIVSLDTSGRTTTTSQRQSLVISDKCELKDINVWATKDEVKSYVMPVLMDLQVGQKYFYIGKGICKVIKVYDYPNRQSNNICRIVFADDAEQDVTIGDRSFVYLPYNYVSELNQFNISTNELALQPRVSVAKPLINVIWQPVEDAARYVVKLYRYVNAENRRKVYFLKDYEVDRNEHFLSISDLVFSEHIVVVIAENRAGEVVAQARGIDIETSSEPKWF